MPGAVYKTTNGGDIWTDISEGLGITGGKVTALDVTDSHIYVSVWDEAAGDGENTWLESYTLFLTT